MIEKIESLRGCQDLDVQECKNIAAIEESIVKACKIFGFKEVETPIVERTELFSRSMGDFSDAVSKEMYSFQDRGGRNISLRPELTAGIVRAFGLNDPNKERRLYAIGDAFRYERPQKGRRRQFKQLSCEMIGCGDVISDIECIIAADKVLKSVDIPHESIRLKINFLGDFEERKKFNDALKEYFSNISSELSEEARLTINRNPMRILDSKRNEDKKAIINAPSIKDFLKSESLNRFEKTIDILGNCQISAEIDYKLVRGLDYYCGIVFEFETNLLGAQSTILAGGRYDGLSKLLGGSVVPAIGFACGIERLSSIATPTTDTIKSVYMLIACEEATFTCFSIAENLRNNNVELIVLSCTESLKRGLKSANEANARLTLIVGERELINGSISLKDMTSGKQEEILMNKIVDKVLDIIS